MSPTIGATERLTELGDSQAVAGLLPNSGDILDAIVIEPEREKVLIPREESEDR